MVTKLINDGKVGVIYSPDFGAGWSTWNPEYSEFLLFDSRLVQAVLDEDLDKVVALVTEQCPDAYISNNLCLAVEFIPIGTQFRIHEYDGSESIVYLNKEHYWTA